MSANTLLKTLEEIRTSGWAVAVHNDYRLNGGTHTFWLFTKGDRALKGEGRTDAEALEQVRAAIASSSHADQPIPTDVQIAELAVECGLPYGPDTWNALIKFAHNIHLLTASQHQADAMLKARQS